MTATTATGRRAPAVAVPAATAPPRLGAVVLVAGTGSLAVEISASRLLAPYFGDSTVVWANLIGLILIYLSAGYWLGGRIADRHPSPRRLGAIILAAACVIAVIPFVAHPVLRVALVGFDRVSAGAVVGSFVATVLLFAVPVTLLGMVTPFALRLGLRDVDTAGAVSGRLYALSTIGSILGTFVPALVTVPLAGTQRTMIGAAVLLAVAATPLLPRRALLAPPALALLLLIPPGLVKDTGAVLFETESAYQYIQIQQHPDGSRTLSLNEGVTAHSVWRANTVLTGSEWDMFLVVPPLVTHPVRHVLIVGNAGGTMARAYARFYPQASIDGVELDGAVTDASRRWLGLGDNPRLHVVTADGRQFLETTASRYDVIIVDAYRQPYIPFYLATEEFFSLAHDHLVPGGMLALNVERFPGDTGLSDAVETTVAAVFPHTWVWPALRYNELVVATDDAADRSALLGRLDGVATEIRPLVPLVDAQLRPAATRGELLTDDRAPVEWLTDRGIVQYIAGGGNLDEHFLPTRP